MTDTERIALAARVFTLAAVGSICAVSGLGLQSVGLVLAVVVLTQLVALTETLPVVATALLEGALAAFIVIAAHPHNDAALTYLALPPLVAGLLRGYRLVLVVVLVEVAVVLTSWALFLIGPDPELLAEVITWFLTGLGLGYLGTVVRGTLATSSVDASYRSALDLIKQLQALSGKLESGLDPVSIAEQLMAKVDDTIVVRQQVVLLRTDDGTFSPLRYADGAQPGTFGDVDDLLDRCWDSRKPAVDGFNLALPLATDSQVVAILLVECDATPDLRGHGDLEQELEREAVRLYAALLFTEVRESATSEERQRLAREVHDGVAQDVASLGYLVDNLAAGSAPEEAHRFATLRNEVSRVVKELRTSVFDLRNEVAGGQGLGQSVATFARQVGSHSDLTVHVTLDEDGVRLRPQVEAELLRITQEAINNARRHSKGKNLWVSVEVRPPHAAIDVVDDGDGLGTARPDSHGLRIMRERADRVGALLEVASPAVDGRGTRLSVRLTPADNAPTAPSPATTTAVPAPPGDASRGPAATWEETRS